VSKEDFSGVKSDFEKEIKEDPGLHKDTWNTRVLQAVKFTLPTAKGQDHSLFCRRNNKGGMMSSRLLVFLFLSPPGCNPLIKSFEGRQLEQAENRAGMTL
jgi:hypothetical protein